MNGNCWIEYRKGMTKEDKILLMDMLEKLNAQIKNTQGHFDLSNNVLQQFLTNNHIVVGKFGARNIKKHSSSQNYILCTFDSTYSRQGTVPNPDPAHDVLRHIRNSIAHSLVSTPLRKSYFELRDKNKCGNDSMLARINKDLLPSLVDKIIQTYH